MSDTTAAATEQAKALAFLVRQERIGEASAAREAALHGNEDERRRQLDAWKALLPMEQMAEGQGG